MSQCPSFIDWEGSSKWGTTVTFKIVCKDGTHCIFLWIYFSIFGVPFLKAFQLEAINAVLNKEYVFVCAPTGSGKSLCFWDYYQHWDLGMKMTSFCLSFLAWNLWLRLICGIWRHMGSRHTVLETKIQVKFISILGKEVINAREFWLIQWGKLLWQNQRLYSFTVIQLPLYKNIQINLSLAWEGANVCHVLQWYVYTATPPCAPY